MPSELEKLASDMATLTTSVTGLVESQKAIQGLVTQQGTTQAQLTEAITGISNSLAKGLTVNTPADKPAEIDLAEASVADLAKYIMTQVSDMNKETREQFTTEMNSLKDGLSKDGRQAELDKTRELKGNEDLDDFLPEMAGIAKVNPNLSMPQLLKLARDADPEKAEILRKEIDIKIEAANPDKDKDKEQGLQFGGLTPTSGDSVVSDDDDKKPVTIADGLLKAWDSVVPKDMDQTAKGEDAFF